ncbi:MAG: ABC transporter substrate-binding protein, partial [Anaerolineales bacterium]|nr:ABC transporter substrate-binding protein [Anaerolineales bacterium]
LPEVLNLREDPFKAADYLQKEAAERDEQNLRKLMLNRLDLVVVDQFVAESVIAQIPEAEDSLEFLSPPLDVKPLYLILSRNTENSAQKLADFNEGLRQIIADGTVAKIMEKHGLN